MSDVTKIKLPDNSELNIKDYRIPGVDSTPASGSNNVVTSGGIHTAMADTELVVATALNDLNDRVSDLEDGAETLESDSVWEAGTGTNSVIVKDSLGNAGGNYSTVEGKGSVTGGTHTAYDLTPDTADATAGSYAHAEGRYTIACGKQGSHAEGDRTLATSQASHAEGVSTIASGSYSHAEGGLTAATGGGSHAEGRQTTASGSYSHAEGYKTLASATATHAEGNNTKATVTPSHAEGYFTLAAATSSHAEGFYSAAIGQTSHAEAHCVAYGTSSHAEAGNKGVDVFPVGSANATTYTSVFDSEWNSVRNEVGDTVFLNVLKNSVIVKKNDNQYFPIKLTDASFNNETLTFTVEETLSDTALNGSVGYWISFSISYGDYSHCESSGNVSYGTESHAEGYYIFAIGNQSHTEGKNTVAKNITEHAEGSFNVSNKASDTYGNAGNTQHSIGIGNSTTRKNALEIMQNGDLYVMGVGSYDGTNYSSASSLQSVLSNIPAAVTESTVSGWGFTKNTGTYSKPSGGIPATDLASAVQTSLGKADTALQSFTETDPTVPAWAKQSTKPTYTASEVGALPSTTVIPAAPGTLTTTSTTALSTATDEALSGSISLHKIAKTGSYSDLIGAPAISSNIATDKVDNTKIAGTKATYDEIHPAVVTSQPAGGFAPNVLYDLGTITGTVTFTMASPTDATIINHYYWTFETSSTAPTITWPAGITSWYGGSAPIIVASKHYEISVLDGVGCYMEV